MAHNTISRFCEKCGNVFKTNQTEITKGGGRFCSNKCFHSSRKVTLVKSICETCRNVFNTPLGKYNDRIKQYGKSPRFCSVKCSGQSPEHRALGKNNLHYIHSEESITKAKSAKQTSAYHIKASAKRKSIWATMRDKYLQALETRKQNPRWIAHFESNKGSGNPNWKGGRRSERETAMGRKEYIDWRTSVFKRDKYTCQHCGKTGDLHAHHIKQWSTYPEFRYSISNGITLCIPCHRKIPHSR